MLRRLKRALSIHSGAAITMFIITGTLAGTGVALIIIGILTAIVPVGTGILGAGALAAWTYAVWRFIDLAHQPTPPSLDCRDGRHDACLICGCICHHED